jgi:hypothetical protein
MYLDDDTAAIRKEAALTCAQLLLQPGMVVCVFGTGCACSVISRMF